ncbi:DUF305 domain-containing protein [Streptomyces fulvorobeus]|uniref:Lipoprotein n=1 Tax=Streptomyces fulvorobeus TaxID=284028 RepID=A0A7J0CFF0_9ACTN|nr:DUF305 domain-containing protein [Streptomyces fulvorobeus]NYE44683.1 uncharacterized protein (DUF305 family) [Streptomyces fulvorobeus]GFN01231.1 lipoprotein [Streptomyces fulvorobeus]
MSTKRSLIRRATAVAAAATAALALAACGGNGDDSGSAHNGHNAASPAASTPAQQGDHNAADTAFAQGMIPHHRQAIEMADLAATRAESAEVKKLAAEIKKAQDPEIKTLTGWLTSWGEQIPAEGAGHEGHDMAGMMAAQEMNQLEPASGKAFDTAFLTMMVKHHEGAVAMAKTEQADGTYQPAKDMAQAIITSQSAEIARMNTLLGKS